VFILSRIREGWNRGMGNTAAVEHGHAAARAGVVTAAAVRDGGRVLDLRDGCR
jgi:hypothetical protein